MTKARHEGQCVRCGDDIHVGDEIESAPGGGWRHKQCPEPCPTCFRTDGTHSILCR